MPEPPYNGPHRRADDRRLDDLRQEVRELEAKLERKLDDLTDRVSAIPLQAQRLDAVAAAWTAALDATEARLQSELHRVAEQVGSLQSDRQWLVRIVVGLVVVALVGLVVTQAVTAPR